MLIIIAGNNLLRTLIAVGIMQYTCGNLLFKNYYSVVLQVLNKTQCKPYFIYYYRFYRVLCDICLESLMWGIVCFQNNTGLSVWSKAIEPVGSRAIAFMYTKDHGYPLKVAVTLYEIGLAASTGYDIAEVFSGNALGSYKPWDVFVCYVNPTGVYLITAKPL